MRREGKSPLLLSADPFACCWSFVKWYGAGLGGWVSGWVTFLGDAGYGVWSVGV